VIKQVVERAQGAPAGLDLRSQRDSNQSVPVWAREPKDAIAWVVGGAFEFKNWSGARDSTPGPHGPEPCRRRVLEYPVGSADVRLNSSCRALVSLRVLLDPPGAGNLCPGECLKRRGPANYLALGNGITGASVDTVQCVDPVGRSGLEPPPPR